MAVKVKSIQEKISFTQRDVDLKGLSANRRKGFSLRDVDKSRAVAEVKK
jgi:hypothetical protein